MTGVLPVAVLMALAVAVLTPPAPAKRLARLRPAAPAGAARGLPVVVGGCVLALVWVVLGTRVLGWVVMAGLVVGTVAWVVHRGARAARLAAAERGTARAAATVALLLGSGRIPTEALAEAAEDCPALDPAAAAVRLGGDVGAALEAGAAEPGRHGLAALAAAWRVSEQTGAPVAGIVAQVAENLRHDQQVADVVAAELSAARTSGRIMAVLPFAAIALGSLVGASPLAFLFGPGPGQWVLLAGVALAAGGVVWTEHIASVPGTRRRPSRRGRGRP